MRRLFVSVAVWFSLVLVTTSAYALSDDELLDRGINSFNQQDYLSATMYLFAYQQRGPELLKSDSVYRAKVDEALSYAINDVREQNSELERLRSQASAQQKGSLVRGVTSTPPRLGRPPSCVLSGRLIDHASRSPLSGVTIHLYSAKNPGQGVEYQVATTARTGNFYIDCSRISESNFPIEFGLQRNDWPTTELVGPEIGEKGRWMDLVLKK